MGGTADMIRPFRGVSPKIAASCYIDPSAQFIGDVEIGEGSCMLADLIMLAVVRDFRIRNVSAELDNLAVYVEHEMSPPTFGEGVTVGLSVSLVGCVVEDAA